MVSFPETLIAPRPFELGLPYEYLLALRVSTERFSFSQNLRLVFISDGVEIRSD